MYKQIAIPFFFLVVAAFTFFVIYRMKQQKQNGHSTKRTIISLLFAWYLCAVAAMTVVPIRASRTQNLPHHFNFVPVIKSYQRLWYVQKVNDQQGIRNFRNNFVGNILMFVPMGIFLSLLYRHKFWKVFLISAMASCIIEFIQFLNMHWGYYRFVDVDDVILNTLGGVVGYAIIILFVGRRL